VSTTTIVPDELLVTRARGGDLAAFGQLVERHATAVRRLARGIVGEHDAEDVTQEALMRAFHRLDRFRGEGAFRFWLLRIAHNAALDALARRRPGERSADRDPGTASPPGERTPAEQLELTERRLRLHEKIDLLTPQHRAVLVLRDLEGLSYEEIAQVTQTPVGSVKGRLHRARQQLIDLLRANTYDWELPRA